MGRFFVINYESPLICIFISATTDWQYYQFNFTAVKNPELRQDAIRLNFMYGTTQGVLYIDDILIEEE